LADYLVAEPGGAQAPLPPWKKKEGENFEEEEEEMRGERRKKERRAPLALDPGSAAETIKSN
jgi:hypothetical protein